ncbi:glycine-rich domain-containing protein 1 [Ricinus communis]|uniref:GRDP C2 domain-containing protein n=1 Tax=Ricinus communis TaxID=3988 RepID=B9SMX4_RICCO|nr:glycine-rich domain-containing protein 1 [Ricinus communis]EEF35015.1 conserved hypothetical protein [Ricinus communis]|eukprot:XP_002527343.1 glycine-rich domain-containing protein 1 [Ricinus communis]
MEKLHEVEWAEAQKISITVDLVAAAKQQLSFLAEVDKHRELYEGPALDRAIYRYRYCWLPLLAKHLQAQVSEGPLVVPLDCEWIWHCHRLNPVHYIKDCKEFYGKILGNWNIVSSTQATCKKQTEEIWNRMYPNEPYELKLSSQISVASGDNVQQAQKSTNYDLISAVKRQSPFYYQVSRAHMNDDSFLQESVARYKGFLHLIKRNQERSIRQFCVPTYDIDLIWHSHQLHPVAYCKDLVAIIGRVLEHDDTDSDRTKGKKLDTGFSGTTKQWGETFGSRYWRAGAMYRGRAPSLLATDARKLDTSGKKGVDFSEYKSTITISKKLFAEVMLEIVGVGDLPAEHRGNLIATFSKKQPDTFFHGKTRLNISFDTGEKQIAVFQCEPVGELVCELASYSPTVLRAASPAKMLGTASISLQDLVKPGSPLSVEKWFELMPHSRTVGSQPINLRIAISFTPPILAPFIMNLVKMDGGGNFNGGSNYSAVHEMKMDGGANCNGGSNYNGGGNCNGGSNYNGGGNCNGGSNYNGGGNCNGGSNYNQVGIAAETVKGSHCTYTAEDIVKSSHCLPSDYCIGDIVKSSHCGGCGGCGGGGGGCRGGGCGGCHGGCGH